MEKEDEIKTAGFPGTLFPVETLLRAEKGCDRSAKLQWLNRATFVESPSLPQVVHPEVLSLDRIVSVILSFCMVSSCVGSSRSESSAALEMRPGMASE